METNPPERLFAYGTLQVPRVMAAVTGRRFEGLPAALEGYRRRRVRDADYPGILPDPSDRTTGTLYSGLGPEDLDLLDRFEGDLYRRRRIRAVTGDGREWDCWAYVVRDGLSDRLGREPWRLEDFLAEGYRRFMAEFVGRPWNAPGGGPGPDARPGPGTTSTAIVRPPGPRFAEGITTRTGPPPDASEAAAQHRNYIQALEALGVEVLSLPVEPDHPDACFVEDTAVVTPEVAVIARPGAPSRRGETASVRRALAGLRPLARIEAPGTLDGGDVLAIDREVFIGLSERTDRHGAGQLADHLSPLGYRCREVPVGGGLHLKSGVGCVGDGILLVAPDYDGHPAFRGYRCLAVPPRETDACNALAINGSVLVPAGFPVVRAMVAGLGCPVVEVEVGEFRQMDGGLSCLSLRL